MFVNMKEGIEYPSFEEQFAARERFGERGVSVLDVIPPNHSDNSILIIPGWRAQINDYKKPVRYFFGYNRRVLSVELSGDEDQKAEDINSLIYSKKVRGVDVVAHSVGAISVVKAALDRPNAAGKIILVNPASMIGDDSIKELIRRYGELRKGASSGNIQETRSKSDFIEMAKIITEFDMYEYLGRLKELGVNIITLHAQGDVLFPYDRVAREAEKRGWEDLSEISGGHLSIDSAVPFVLDRFNS